MELVQVIPKVLLGVLPREFTQIQVRETLARCEQCPMAQAQGLYHPDLKCCTFHPFLPNFMVGAILEEGDSCAQKLIKKRLQNRQGLLLTGIRPPISYQTHFRQQKSFGTDSNLLCPYFDRHQGNCGVWAYRSSVCVEFICHSSYGQLGHQFWRQLGDHLHSLEMAISQEALLYQGWLWPEIQSSLSRLEDSSNDSDGELDYELIYRTSYRWFCGLSQQQIRELAKNSESLAPLYHLISQMQIVKLDEGQYKPL